MSFSLIITFFTVMKVDEFHNILAAKAAYLFLWSRPPILLKQWKLLQLPIPQEICFLSAIWTILIRFLVFSESFSWVSLVYSSADCFLSLHGSCQHSTHCFQQCGRSFLQCSSGIRCPEWCLSEYFMVSPVDSVFRYAGISASQKQIWGPGNNNRSMDAEK